MHINMLCFNSLIIFLISFSVFSETQTIELTKDQIKMIEKFKNKSEDQSEKSDQSGIYVPVANKKERINEFVRVKRDDSRILEFRVSPNDSIDAYMCFNSPLRVTFGQTIPDTLSNALIDDKNYFTSAVEEDSGRSAVVTLIKAVPKGQTWQSTLRLTRKSDSRAYLVNVIAIACPERGVIPFAKEIRLEQKMGINSGNTEIMHPEDLIIEKSKGYTRKNDINKLDVYGLVTSSDSSWAVLSVSLRMEKDIEKRKYFTPKFIVLDSLQVREIESKWKYLEYSSQKATQVHLSPIMRFSINIQIDKTYILERNYIWLMIIDEEYKYYQYARIALKPYFQQLEKRGFEL